MRRRNRRTADRRRRRDFQPVRCPDPVPRAISPERSQRLSRRETATYDDACEAQPCVTEVQVVDRRAFDRFAACRGVIVPASQVSYTDSLLTRSEPLRAGVAELAGALASGASPGNREEVPDVTSAPPPRIIAK